MTGRKDERRVDYERNCRAANNLLGTTIANLTRATAFGLHAAADAQDRDVSDAHLKAAREIRQITARLSNLHFSPESDGSPAEAQAISGEAA